VATRHLLSTKSVYNFCTRSHRDEPHGILFHQHHCRRADPRHRRAPLLPGTKLAEQKLADHFGVSRTLVRQALFQLSQNRLVTLEPARGAFVATPRWTRRARCSPCAACWRRDDARLCAQVTPARSRRCEPMWRREKAMDRNDVGQRTELLGDFHVRMAELMGNEVLAQLLGD
jgi:DNA-binding GntR family transcriptional regulator